MTIVLIVTANSICSPAYGDAVTDYNLAVQFYKQERWKLAADACADFVKNYPNHNQVAMAHLYWGQSLIHLRDFAKAREQFRLYLKDPKALSDRALAMYRVGECSYFLNDAKAAEQELGQFLKEHDDHDLTEWAIVYLANTQFQLNKVQEAIVSFETSLAKFSEGSLKSEAEYGLARAFEVDGQTSKAVDLYERILLNEKHPNAAEAQFHLAALHFEAARYDKAGLAFRGVIEKFPSHRLAPLAALNAGYAFYQQQQFPEAIKQFELAAQTESQAVTAKYWKGLSFKSSGDYQEASETFQQVLKDAPDNPLLENLLFQRGDAELRLGKIESAMELFAKVYEDIPDGQYADDALHSACEAIFQSGDLTKAAELHEKFAERYASGGLKQVQDLLYGRILIAMGDEASLAESGKKAFYQKAVDVLKSVLESTSVDDTARYSRFQLGRAYERLEDDKSLITVLEPLVRDAAPKDQVAIDSLLLVANANLRQQNFAAAVDGYQRFLPLVESAELRRAALAGLIATQIGQKDWNAVLDHLKKLEAVDPNYLHYSRLSLAAGDAAFDVEKYGEAQKFFQLAVAQTVGNEFYFAAMSGLGHAYYKSENYAEAAKTFAELAKVPEVGLKLGTHAWYMLGMAYRQAGENAAAVEAYRNGLDEYQDEAKTAEPEVQETIYRLAKGAARGARELEKLNDAGEYYEVAYASIQQLPSVMSAELDKLIFEWADMYYNAENFTRADELFKLLIEKTPQSELADDAGLILAESLRFSGKNNEAEIAFRKLTSSEEADDFVKQRCYIHLVDLGAERQNWESVLQDATTLQDQFPENEHQLYLQYRMAEASLQTKKITQASERLEDLRTAILKFSDTPPPTWWEEVWLLQAEAALLQKDYAKIGERVEELRKRSPASKVIHRGDLLIGRSLENQAKFPEAREAYLRVIESETGKGTETAAEAQFRIAESYLKQNNFEAALKEYYKVYAGYDAPTFESAALYQAARSDISMKQWKGAVQTFKILLDEFPESEHVKDAKKQLSEIEAAFPELKRDSP